MTIAEKHTSPRILVFDSGLGGLTVFDEVAKARPDSDFIYVADDAAFPYGALSVEALEARVGAVMAQLIAHYQPDLAVIACNTASTVVMPGLRARFALPFVGIVPAVKPAAAMSKSGVIAILATPGTVSRDYTQALVRDHAAQCRHVALVGAGRLAGQAEAQLRGEAIDEAVIAAEIAPCFVEIDGARTDVVALSCTHFPLLLPIMERLAPWPVQFIDPAEAIARRVTDLMGSVQSSAAPSGWRFLCTGGMKFEGALAEQLAKRGFAHLERLGI
ncbi:MAG: glutamate racemase [Bosea sp. (in: a-proteobacteria)]